MLTLVFSLFCLIVSARGNNDTFHGMSASSQLRGFHDDGVPNSVYRQPAIAGTSAIFSCVAAYLEGSDKEQKFRQDLEFLAWSFRSPNGNYTFLGGRNSTGSVHIAIDPQKYAIDRKTGFLTIYNVAKADETEYKCAVRDQTNLDSEPHESFVKLAVIEKPGITSSTPGDHVTDNYSTAPPSTTTSAPTTSASTTPTTTPRPPDHDRDVDMSRECTGWKIGFASICVLLFVITAVVFVCHYRTADQAGRRVDGGPEVVNTANESHRCVVNYRNGIENGNERGSKATLDDDDDGDVPMLKP